VVAALLIGAFCFGISRAKQLYDAQTHIDLATALYEDEHVWPK
jgi:hypothetical protein